MHYFALLTLVLISPVTAQIDAYLNQKTVDCSSPVFVCINFDSQEVGFNLDDDERNDFNSRLANSITKAYGKDFKLIQKDNLKDYTSCTGIEFVAARLDHFQIDYVGGGERKATIKVSILFFKSAQDNEPYKIITGQATGREDYGHSQPTEDAIKRVAKQITQQLRK